MAIVRRKIFLTRQEANKNDIALIDTADKLIRFAKAHEVNCDPLDVEDLAKKLGIRVEFVELSDDLSGKLFYDEESGQWRIQVNTYHHPNRQRYTIAHELGHFCKHKHLSHIFEDKIFFRGGESKRSEWQANEFASEILMPEYKFKKQVRSGVKEIKDLARFFKVSTLTVRLRAKSLGMSGHGL
ncbi:MAG: ImmA/IrrE family metallo-endopeptidase [Candidatus Aureabacteria bacterium]|nr:ImmA/IrrE family metallo-endopeptidase [Candidatus Auribacterota bacterium]